VTTPAAPDPERHAVTAALPTTHLHSVQPIDGKMLRQVCGHFVTGVTVITSGEVGGECGGTTVNSFTSVSLEPPLVLFCLHNDSRLREMVEGGRSFAVNFLAGRQEQVAWKFAGKQTANLSDVPHMRSAAAGTPVLSDALAFLACTLVSQFDGGDHTIYLGEVVELGAARGRDPLIFFKGALGALADEPHPTHFWDG